MAPLNLPETKIDAPAFEAKQARRHHDPAVQEDGADFDRMVANATEKSKGPAGAEKSKAPVEPPKDSSAVQNAEESIRDQQAPAAGDSEFRAAAPIAMACEPAADLAPLQPAATQDPVLPAAIVAVLQPIAETPIKLPSFDAGASLADAKPIIAAAANGNQKPAQQIDVATDDAAAGAANSPVASADFAALIAALPQYSRPPAGKPDNEIGALPQVAAAVANNSQPRPAATSSTAPAAYPAATVAPNNDAADASVSSEVAPDTTESLEKKIVSGAQIATEEPQIDMTVRPAADGNQPAGMAMARDFLREVTTQYQAASDAGSPARSTGDAAPPEQVSIRLIHSLLEGRKAVQIHLHPSELGSIDVAMQWQGDRLTAHFVVDRPETLDLLQRDIKILEQSLGDSGFRSNDGGLSFSLRQQMEDQGGRRSGNGSPASDQTQNADPETIADESSTMRDGVLVLRV